MHRALCAHVQLEHQPASAVSAAIRRPSREPAATITFSPAVDDDNIDPDSEDTKCSIWDNLYKVDYDAGWAECRAAAVSGDEGAQLDQEALRALQGELPLNPSLNVHGNKKPDALSFLFSG